MIYIHTHTRCLLDNGISTLFHGRYRRDTHGKLCTLEQDDRCVPLAIDRQTGLPREGNGSADATLTDTSSSSTDEIGQMEMV